MTKQEAIQDVIDYIEENLKAEITVEELAQRTYFSNSHFGFLFQKLVGIPCMRYINRRRLLWSLYEMKDGKKGIDAALAYGYNTYSGFYRAFRREFGCTPTQYRKRYAIGKPHKLNLLQEEHCMVSNQKLRTILEHWDGAYENLNEVKFTNGVIADNMWCMIREDNRRYVLSACTDEVSLKRCIELSELEAANGLSTALPVRTKDGERYVTDGDLCFYLTEKKRVVGELKNPTEYYRTEEQAKEVGALLARLHQVLLNYRPEMSFEEKNILETVSSMFSDLRERVSLPEAFYEDYLENFGRLYEKLPKQLIHRDSNYNNIIVEDRKCAGFLHFELAEVNVRIFDLCYAATAVLCEIYMQEDHNEDWFEIYHWLVEGYDQVSPLSDAEKRALPYVIFSIQTICVHYFSLFDKFERQAEVNRKMLLWLWEHKNLLEY